MFIAKLHRVAIFAAAIVLVGARIGAVSAAEPLSDPSDVKAVFEQALSKRDASIVAPYYSETAKLLAPDGSVVDGRSAIQAELQRGYDASSQSLERSRMTVTGDETSAVLVWTWTLKVVTQGGDTTHQDGRSMHYWVKGDHGWQIVYDMYQTFQ